MKNDYRILSDAHTIIYIVSKGELRRCWIDTEDLEKVTPYSWYLSTSGYAVNKRKVTTSMHRLIADCPDGMFVDHISGDKLDNRKSNLRIVTKTQNAQNIKMLSNNKSGYRGVYFEKQTQKYRVQLVINGKTMDFGRYDNVHVAGEVSYHVIKNFMPYANER